MITLDYFKLSIRANLNVYTHCDWYKENKIPYFKVFDEEEDYGMDTQTQGKWGIKRVNGEDIFFDITRGSDEKSDWFGKTGNFNFKKILFEKGVRQDITKKIDTDVQIEAGFYGGYKLIKDKFLTRIERAIKDGVTKFVLTGHSRGGPIASYKNENLGFHFGKHVKNYGIYFSSPRPGNDAYQRVHAERTTGHINIYIIGDPVCLTPFLSMGYRGFRNVKGIPRFIPWPPIVAGHYPFRVMEAIDALKE